jgi:FkbM family methyltransferase
MYRKIKTILIAITAFAMLLASAAAHPKSRAALIYLAGRSAVCPLRNAVNADEELRRTIQIKDRVLSATRLVRTDAIGFDLWDTPKGAFWSPGGDQYVLPWHLAEQDLHIYGSGAHAVRTGEIVLDCGAHVGVFTRVALAAGARRVIAIEPARENFECLRRNLEREIADGRVTLLPVGVWHQAERRRLRVTPHNSAADSVVMHQEGSHEGEEVQLTTIDRIVSDLSLVSVDFIKMDIEGSEQNALRGAGATLKKFKPRISVAAYHMPDDPYRIPELIRTAQPGYRMACGPCARVGWRFRPNILYFE